MMGVYYRIIFFQPPTARRQDYTITHIVIPTKPKIYKKCLRCSVSLALEGMWRSGNNDFVYNSTGQDTVGGAWLFAIEKSICKLTVIIIEFIQYVHNL